MKKLLRIENLLLAVPLGMAVYLIVSSALTENTHPEYQSAWPAIASYFVTQILEWAWFLLPGYLIHYFLRLVARRNVVICAFHVALSLLFTFPMNDYATSVIPGWHTPIYAPLSGLSMVNLLFWLVQLAFIVYGIIIIRRSRKTATS